MNPFIFHPVEQNSDEWSALRIARIGGSGIGTNFFTAGGKLSSGKMPETALIKWAWERMTGQPYELQKWSTAATDFGHEHEPAAAQAVMDRIGKAVWNAGYWENGLLGVSPDRMATIEDPFDTIVDFTVEVKCFQPKAQIETRVCRNQHELKANLFHKYAQVQAQIMATGARSGLGYFGCYHPMMPNPLHLIKIDRDEAVIQMFGQVEERAREFYPEFLKMINQI